MTTKRLARHAAGIVFVLACVLAAVMYWTNHDMAGRPDAPRGGGAYLPILDRGDGHMLYLMARSTALDLDWSFANDLARFGDPWNEPITRTGRKSIVHPIGPALVWTPLIWTAELGALVANALGADIPLHGYTLWHQRFVFFSSVMFGCATALVGLLILRRRIGIGPWASCYAAVAVLLGTSLTYYSTIMPSYGHAMDAFASAAFLGWWAMTLGRIDLRRWIVLGALLGIAALVRPQELALGIVGVVDLGCQWKDRTRLVRVALGGLVALLVAMLVFSVQMYEWHVVFGSATSLPQGPHYSRPGSPMLMEILFSSRNGWFVSTPIAYAGVVGLLCLPRKSRAIAVGLGLAVAIQVYLMSTTAEWWSNASFGQRRLCGLSVPLVVGLGSLIAACGRFIATRRPVWRHVIAAGILGPFVAYNLARVFELRGGRPAPSDATPTCCDRVPGVVRGPVTWWYSHFGNPFEFPASAVFALEHHVSMQRWDVAVGDYPLTPPFGAYRDNTLKGMRARWHIGSAAAERYLVGSWSRPQKDDREFRRIETDAGRLLVPNLMPYAQRLTLSARAPLGCSIRILWDGDSVASATLDHGWGVIPFDIDPSTGTHELEISGENKCSVDVADVDFELLEP